MTARLRSPAQVTVDHATKLLDGVTVLHDVSFVARPGRVTAVLGPNGAGKSTVLRAILGLTVLDSGRTEVGGAPFRESTDPAATVGALLTAEAIHPGRTVRGHLRTITEAGGLDPRAVDDALRVVGLSDVADVRVARLSLGMRQRLGLGGALLAEPAVLVLDEPHNGLDTAAIRWLRRTLRVLADAGRTVVISSHLMGEIQSIADDVVVLKHGRVLVEGELSTLLDDTTLAGALENWYIDAVES